MCDNAITIQFGDKLLSYCRLGDKMNPDDQTVNKSKNGTATASLGEWRELGSNTMTARTSQQPERSTSRSHNSLKQ